MKIQSTSKLAQQTVIALVAWVLIIVLAQRALGTNWAAGVGTVLAIAYWLWSARRSYRQQGPDVGPRLVVDRGGELADEQLPRASHRRIRVANTGTRGIHQVEVTLSKCRPAPAWFQPVRLQRMHGGPHPFALPPQSEVYLELVALPQGHPEFIIVHDSAAHAGLPNGIAIQALELSVRVTAIELPSMTLVFDVSRSALGELEVVSKPR